MSAAPSELLLNRSDSGKTNTDISECSTTTTNTEDYVSCTENSRRTIPGTKLPSASSSSTTQVPGSSPSTSFYLLYFVSRLLDLIPCLWAEFCSVNVYRLFDVLGNLCLSTKYRSKRFRLADIPFAFICALSVLPLMFLLCFESSS